MKDKNEENQIRDLKSLFEQVNAIKEEELNTPSDDISRESLHWYENFMIEAYEEITESSSSNSRVKQQLLHNSIKDFYSLKRRSGSMYTFMYNPESDRMNYWDRFPLVIRMLDNSDSTESFLGINLHYLEPRYRKLLLLNLMTKLDGEIKNPDSRIIGLGMNRLMLPSNRYGRVCIRRYKYDNMRGRALRIPPEYWVKAIFLPTYHFIGGKPVKVWKDSHKKILKLYQRGQ